MARPAKRKLTAKDIMHRQVESVDPQMPVQALMAFFLERQITGAPVIDEEEKVIGVISQTDLLRYQRRAVNAAAPQPGYYYESDGEMLISHMQVNVPASACVQDIMTPAAFMTETDTPIHEIARFMLKRKVHRILVTHKGKLAGIITSMDLLHALLYQRKRPHSTKRRKLHAKLR